MAKRRRDSDNGESSLQKRSAQGIVESSNRQYIDVSFSGDARALLGDNYGILGDTHNHQHHHYSEPPPDRCQKLLESLAFENMDARFRNVAMALPNTCQWLFENNQFRAWSDGSGTSDHNGLLWIKGKPGSGKSTIMKEACAWAERVWHDHITLTYFFNARSPNAIEKSSLGLYQATTCKLVELHPDGRSCLSTRFASKVHHDLSVEPWAIVELQNFLIDLIATKRLPPLTVFIDALDEGDDDDVRDLIIFLDKLSSHASRVGAPLRICLSSRHYPQISFPRGLSLVLEDQSGHDQDIAVYVQRYLAGTENETMELQRRVCNRSAGIFLWVVLVVNMLNKLYDQGKTVSMMIERLDTVPQDLHQVFAGILLRDTEDIDECFKLLRWVLFSLRPLRPIELYFAVQVPSLGTTFTNTMSTHEVITRYLTNCSRGLVERTEARLPTMQFIHETVREFLMNGNVLRDLASTHRIDLSLPVDLQAETCHRKIAEECLRHLIVLSESGHVNESSIKSNLFAEYAAEYWWQHASVSGQVLDQELTALALDLMTNKTHLLTWVRHYNIDRPAQGFKGKLAATDLAPPLYYAASIGLDALVDLFLGSGEEVNATGGRYGNALQAACLKGHESLVQKLLDQGADVSVQGGRYATALQAATTAGHMSIVQLLLSKGANVGATGGYYGTALQAACWGGKERLVQLLIDWKSDINARGGYYGSPLEAAAAGGHERIVQILLDRGAEFNAQSGKLFGNALCAAAEMGRESVVRILLLDPKVDINAQGQYYGSPLHSASRNGKQSIVQMLLEQGADIDAQGGSYGTALQLAVKYKHHAIVRMLQNAGAGAEESPDQQHRELEP